MTTRRSHCPPRSGKPQGRAEATRRALLDAGLAEFSRYGLEGARVERIATKAKVNKQALYYYFGSKEGLFRAALGDVYDRAPPIARSAGQADDSPSAAMRNLIGTLFDHFRSAEQGSAIIADENRYRGAHLTPALRRGIQAAVAPIVDSIAEVLARGQASGEFSRHVRAADLYLTIVALSHFYFTHAYTLSAILGDDLLAPDAMQSWKDHVGTFVVGGLRARDGGRNQPDG